MSAGAPVVVFGLDCPAGLQAARVFWRRGIEVLGIARSLRHPCARTRACSRTLEIDAADATGLGALEVLKQTLDRRAVLLPCSDAAVLAVSRERASLESHFLLAMPPHDAVETLIDKARFAVFATEHRLPIPTTRVLHSRADAEVAAADLRFPVILKPSLKTAQWRQAVSAKVLMARTAASLLMLYDRCAPWCSAMVAQEWIRGLDTDHYTCDCYLGSQGAPLVTFTSRKLRQWPPQIGQGCSSVECRNDAVRDLTIRVLQTAGHIGLGYVEVKQDVESGRHLIVEANVGRPTGRSAAAEGAGVEFLMTMYRDLTDAPLPEQRIQHFTGAKWIHVRRDVQACARLWWKRRATLRELIGSWKGPRTFPLLSARDPVPFFADLWRVATEGFNERPALAAPSSEGNGKSGHHEAQRPLTRADGRERGRRPERVRARPPAMDFDVGGVVRVRVLDAEARDLAVIRRTLGPPTEHLAARPDIFVRMVDHLPVPELRLLNGGSVGYGSDGLYVLRAPGGPALARLRLGERWGASAIVCRRGVRDVPGLAPMVDLVALVHGWIPLHASAWTMGGTGVIAAGWAGSGKTGALLSFLERGATAVGDDRVFVSRDGSSMVGLGGAIEVHDWHLPELPRFGARAGRWRRALAPAGPRLEALTQRMAAAPRIGGGLAARCARGAVRRFRGRLGMELPARSVSRTLPGSEPERASPDVVILLESHRLPTFVAERIEPGAMAARLAAMVLEGFLPTLRNHLLFQYAFPGGGRNGIEGAPLVVMNMLGEALADKPGYVVRHPYPCSLRALREAIAPLVQGHAKVAVPDGEEEAGGSYLPTTHSPAPPERHPPYRRWQ